MSKGTFEIKLKGLSKIYGLSSNALIDKCEFKVYNIPHSYVSDHGPVYWDIFCWPTSNRFGEVTDVILYNKPIYMDINPGYLWKFDHLFTQGISVSKLMFVACKLVYEDSDVEVVDGGAKDYLDNKSINSIHVYECDKYAVVKPMIRI